LTRRKHHWRPEWVIVAVLAVIVIALIGHAGQGQTPSGAMASGPSTSLPATPLPSTQLPSTAAASSTPTTTTATNTPTPGPTPGDVMALLDSIPVKGRAPNTGYDGSQAFWGMWQYTNDCSTRNLILARDLTQVTYRSRTSCVVNTGILNDPYTGTTVDFQYGAGPGQSDAIEIDHVVARQNAWVTGAFAWTPEQRYAFANDPLDLLAVGAAINQAKGNGDAATWLPPNKAFRCQFVTIQVKVKAKYNLWMTKAEHDAIARILINC